MAYKTKSPKGGRPTKGNSQAVEPDTVGYRLRKTRESSRLTLLQMADSLGITDETLGAYERNKRLPDVLFLQRYCLKFGVSADWLVLGREPAAEAAAVEPVPYDGEKMKLAMDIADALADAGRLRRGVTKSDYATALYEFFSTAKGLPG